MAKGPVRLRYLRCFSGFGALNHHHPVSPHVSPEEQISFLCHMQESLLTRTINSFFSLDNFDLLVELTCST
jgi:hypothetical protein